MTRALWINFILCVSSVRGFGRLEAGEVEGWEAAARGGRRPRVRNDSRNLTRKTLAGGIKAADIFFDPRGGRALGRREVSPVCARRGADARVGPPTMPI